MGGHRCLPCGQLLSVVLCVVGGGGKEKRGHVMLPKNVVCYSSQINNKQIKNSTRIPPEWKTLE